jgi:hypothetical protein
VRADPDAVVLRCPSDEVAARVNVHFEPGLLEPRRRKPMGLVLGVRGMRAVRARPPTDGIQLLEPVEDAHARSVERRRRYRPPHARARGVSLWRWVQIALAAFVLAWILGPSELRDAVPILLVFLVAVGLEVQFLVSALRNNPAGRPDRRPQEIDRERYGFEREPDDIVVVEDGCDEVWLGLTDEAEDDLVAEEDAEDDVLEPEHRAWHGPVRRFAIGLGVIAAFGALVWFLESRTGWDSLGGETQAAAVRRFSEEASRIAEKPVSIRCDEARDYVGAVQHADGVAEVGGDLAILTPEICNDLYELAFENETTGSRTGRAVAVLAHEAWHLRGVADEGTTECYALQSGVELGERLGLSEGTARQLMRQQLTENQLRGLGSLEYRVTSQCADGERLDLHPSDDSFP